MEIETANNRSIVVSTVAHIYIYIYTYVCFHVYTWEILISVKNIYDMSISNDYITDVTLRKAKKARRKEKIEKKKIQER